MAGLERAYKEHDQQMVYIKAYTGWDALRSERKCQSKQMVDRLNPQPA